MFVENVGTGDFVVELDAIEERRSAVEEHDVAQVQVAVALAHESRGTPLVEQGCMMVEFRTRALGQPAARRRIQNVRAVFSKTRGIPFDDPRHPRLAAVIRSRLGDAVELRDRRSQRRH